MPTVPYEYVTIISPWPNLKIWSEEEIQKFYFKVNRHEFGKFETYNTHVQIITDGEAITHQWHMLLIHPLQFLLDVGNHNLSFLTQCKSRNISERTKKDIVKVIKKNWVLLNSSNFTKSLWKCQCHREAITHQWHMLSPADNPLQFLLDVGYRKSLIHYPIQI